MNSNNCLHICLFQPEIPQNTGNIGRLAAATRAKLHLIKPLGFSLSDRYLKRAGLDYWQFLDLSIHESFEDFLSTFESPPLLSFYSTKGSRYYWDSPAADVLVFGRETAGLPESLHQKYKDYFVRIPILHQGVRSLNLANSVSIALYHQLSLRKKTLDL